MSEPFKFDWVVVEKMRPADLAAARPNARPMRKPESPFAGGQLVGADASAAVPDLQIKRMTLNEAREERQSDNVAALLIYMPMRLITPTSQSAAMDVDTGTPPWGLTDVRAGPAGQSEWTGKGVTVAVLDTGIAAHEAFSHLDGKILPRNFTHEGGPTDVTDHDGHGTHCAGTIVGGTVNGLPIGVAPGVDKVLIGKIIGKDSGGDARTVAQALYWAMANGADVISMSIGIDFAGYLDSLITKYRIENRRAAAIALEGYRLSLESFNTLSKSLIGVAGMTNGAVVIGAAGNESDLPNYSIPATLPSSAPEFVSVAALKPPANGHYELASFSNVGTRLAAPGVNVLSAALNGGFASMDGTSMAAPHVAGAACLWVEKLAKDRQADRRPRPAEDVLDARAVIEALKTSAAPLTPSISKEQVMWGRVQAPP